MAPMMLQLLQPTRDTHDVRKIQAVICMSLIFHNHDILGIHR